MDKIHAMQVFVSVVDSHRFPRAAESQSVTTGAGVENAMGTRLLHRTTRSMEPTPAIKGYVV